MDSDLLHLTVGGLLVVVTLVDLVWTVLWVDGGAGPLSSPLSERMWRGFRRVAGDRSRLLSLAGPVILVVTIATWIGLVAAGWVLLFAGGENALLNTRGPSPVTWTGRIWYVAYTMFTDGNGDFTPHQGVWQLVSALVTASGMIVATMGVTYVLQIVDSVSKKRTFASDVTGIGERSERFVESGWNGEDLGGLDLPLERLASDLSELANRHEAYPILHYYHTEQAQHASALAVAVLDESLLLVEHGVPEEYRPSVPLLQQARSSTRDYLDTLDALFVQPADEPPPPPDLDRLRRGDVPTLPDAEFEAALDDAAEHRRTLLGMVEADRWGDRFPPRDE